MSVELLNWLVLLDSYVKNAITHGIDIHSFGSFLAIPVYGKKGNKIMPTISCREVKKTRSSFKCPLCFKYFDAGEPSVVLFGMAHRGEPPYQIRICIPCDNLSKQARLRQEAK
jgi:hypothetical protein